MYRFIALALALSLFTAAPVFAAPAAPDPDRGRGPAAFSVFVGHVLSKAAPFETKIRQGLDG